MENKVKLCTRCVLPETFPGIKFDDHGVCNFCNAAKTDASIADEKKEYRAKFETLIASLKGKADYDCTVAFSGGKDSTYTLQVVKQVFGLKPLAVTFDNGFISEQAFRNIRTVTETLGVDSVIFKADFQMMKKIYHAAIERPMYSPKTLERASTICTSCIGLAKFIILKTALEKKIPMMAWGWTPGQAPIRSAIMKINPVLFKSTQEALRKPMHEAVGDTVNRYFLTEDLFKTADFPYNISPLAFMDYNEKDIVKEIQKLGWKAPSEVDANSTNCLLNSFANRFHIDTYGFHPYAFEIAGMVRTGVMPRAEGLEKLEESENKETVKYVKQKLGI
jgi:hypothetical protein